MLTTSFYITAIAFAAHLQSLNFPSGFDSGMVIQATRFIEDNDEFLNAKESCRLDFTNSAVGRDLLRTFCYFVSEHCQGMDFVLKKKKHARRRKDLRAQV